MIISRPGKVIGKKLNPKCFGKIMELCSVNLHGIYCMFGILIVSLNVLTTSYICRDFTKLWKFGLKSWKSIGHHVEVS